MAIPNFTPILPRLDMDNKERQAALGLIPSDKINWVYRPTDIAAKQAKADKYKNMGGFAAAAGFYNPTTDPTNYFHPETGQSRTDYEDYLNTTSLKALEDERARVKAVSNFFQSPEGKAFIVRNQYNLFKGNQVDPLWLQPGRKYVTNYTSPGTFDAPTIYDPFHGKEWQDAYSNYYNQFMGGNFSDMSYAAQLFGGQGPFRNYNTLNYLFDSGSEYSGRNDYIDAVKDDPELLDFLTKWNAAVKEAGDWTAKLKNPYSTFLGVTPEGYKAPTRYKTTRYGIPFGGTGVGGLGKDAGNPVPDEPGAGLWVAGIDPANLGAIADAYNNLFFYGTDTGAQKALAAFAPKRNADGSWYKATNINDLFSFASEYDKYIRLQAKKNDLPKRGILSSLPGQILAGLITAGAGNIGPIWGALAGAATSALAGGNPLLGGLTGGLGGYLKTLTPAGLDVFDALGQQGLSGIPSSVASYLAGAPALLSQQLGSPFFWLNQAQGYLIDANGNILKAPSPTTGDITPPAGVPITPTLPAVPTLPTGVAPVNPETPVIPTTPVNGFNPFDFSMYPPATEEELAQKKFDRIPSMTLTPGPAGGWNFTGLPVEPTQETIAPTPVAPTLVAPTPVRPTLPSKRQPLPMPTPPLSPAQRRMRPPARPPARAQQIPPNVLNKIQRQPMARVPTFGGPIISNNAAGMIATPPPARPPAPSPQAIAAAKMNRLPR